MQLLPVVCRASPVLFIALCSLPLTAGIRDFSKAFLSEQPSLNEDGVSNCRSACDTLRSRVPESVFTGNLGNFQFWDAKQTELVPECRVEPLSVNELSFVLRTAIEKGCHFAVKSGGHGRTPGVSNVANGVTIDLVRLNEIEIAKDRHSVRIGAGLRWGDVYEALEREQLMVLGGRVADVGVGGLLLGGGISFFSNARGLACDSIISYELVLPNSTIVTVDTDNNPDLYRGLRGAGQMNFGIVSAFTLETFPLRHGIWSGYMFVAGPDIQEMLQVNHEVITNEIEADPNLAIILNYSCLNKEGNAFASLAVWHTTHNSTQRWPASLLRYKEMKAPDISGMSIAPVSNITRSMDQPSLSGKTRTIYGAISYEPCRELESEILRILCEEVEPVRDMTGFKHGVSMHPLSTAIVRHSHKNGGNAFQSMMNQEGPLIVLNIIWQWEDKADDERAYASYRQLESRIEEAIEKSVGLHPYKYLNYAEAGQDIWEGYAADYGHLQRLQRDVDPQGIFTADGLAGGAHKLNDASALYQTTSGAAAVDYLGRDEL